jgi:hypothetical protein
VLEKIVTDGTHGQVRLAFDPPRGPEDLLSEPWRSLFGVGCALDAEGTWLLAFECSIPDYQPRLFPMGELWEWVPRGDAAEALRAVGGI